MAGELTYFKNVLDNLYDGVYFTDHDRKIMYWNGGAERISGWTNEDIVGKSCKDNILIHVDEAGNKLCLGGCPLSATLADGEFREADVYLHHKDGHRVPVSVRVAPLRDDGGAIIGAVEIFNENSMTVAVRSENERLREMMLLDLLTGIGNRLLIDRNLNSFINEASRYDWPFGLLFIDIDNFKTFNDQYGHIMGDKILSVVANTIACGVRSFDVAGRWGGEEFIIVLKHVGIDELTKIAEKLRMLVEYSTVAFDDSFISVTISVGATVFKPGDTPESLINRADQLMYESKSKGKNCVTVGI